MDHAHRHHGYADESRRSVSHSATGHCLLGSGLGEVAGMIIGTALALSKVATILLAVLLGLHAVMY